MSVSAKTKNVTLIDPEKIRVVHDLRGRKIKPTKDDIRQMAVSIEETGQQQEVKVRPLPAGQEDGCEYVSIFGSTRIEAVELLKLEGKKPNKVLCEVQELDDQQAFELTIRENNDRKETTPVDDAHNQEIFRTRFGMKDAAIAKMWGCSAARVSQLKSLLEASAKVQIAVAKGLVSADAAIELVQSGASASEQGEILADAKERFGSEKLSRSQVKTSMNMLKPLPVEPEEPEGDASSNGAAPAKATKTGRTSKQVIAAFKENAQEGASTNDGGWKKFAKANILFIEGKRTFGWLYQQACKFREAGIYDEDVPTDEDDGSEE